MKKNFLFVVIFGMTLASAYSQDSVRNSKKKRLKHSRIESTTVSGVSKKHKHSNHSDIDGVSTFPGKTKKHKHSYHSTITGVNP